jgi:hypothetical protein
MPDLQTKNSEKLQKIRHSAAHVMAKAVMRLFRGQNGFLRFSEDFVWKLKLLNLTNLLRIITKL